MTTNKLPSSCFIPAALFPREVDLCDYLMQQPGFWRSIGCETPAEMRTHTTPDFMCRIYRGKPHETLGVEVEYTPQCFHTHGHDSFNVDLLVTLYASHNARVTSNTPIISLYRRAGWSDAYVWSLEDDLNVLYKGKRSTLFDNVSYGLFAA